MQVNQNASLVAQQSLHIDAPIEQVWAIQTDLARWPTWQPDISSVTLEGDVAAGSVFRWKANGLTIVSTLQVVDAPRQIGWTGDAIGMHAVHVWHFEPQDGGTRVTTEESLDGWLVRLIKLFDKRFLEKSLEKSLMTLKTKVESGR